MNLRYISIVAGLVFAAAQPATAGDAAVGEKAYAGRACIGCHGPGGVSANPSLYPTLKGKDAAFIAEQLNAFRDGSRSNPLMTPMSTGLSDEDVANIAAYIAALK